MVLPFDGRSVTAVFVSQFLSQPFLVGDRVEVATATGTRVLTGVVERIDPMRTIVRSDQDVPITIPNKASRALNTLRRDTDPKFNKFPETMITIYLSVPA